MPLYKKIVWIFATINCLLFAVFIFLQYSKSSSPLIENNIVSLHKPVWIIKTNDNPGWIFSLEDSPASQEWKWIILDKTTILTAAHVVGSLNSRIEVSQKNNTFLARVKKIDTLNDLAVLEYDYEPWMFPLEKITLPSRILKVDDQILLGNTTPLTESKIKNTQIQKNLWKKAYNNLIEVNTPLQIWDSWSPVFSQTHQLIGISILSNNDFWYVIPLSNSDILK